MALKHQFEPLQHLPLPHRAVGYDRGQDSMNRMKTLLSFRQLPPYKESVSMSGKVDEGHAALLRNFNQFYYMRCSV